MINDIVEKEVAAPRAPSAPQIRPKADLWKRSSRGGRSGRKVGTGTVNENAQACNPNMNRNFDLDISSNLGPRAGTLASDSSSPMSEQEQIHLENLQKLSQMSPKEIEQERQELIASMDANVLASLLKRAEIKEMTQRPTTTTAAAAAGSQCGDGGGGAIEVEGVAKNVASEDPKSQAKPQAKPQAKEQQPKESLHFPPPPEDLKKFFPDTPVETSKLAWMQPVDPQEELEYSQELASVAPSQLRFDFRGNLLTPRISSQIDTCLGLHHHADAPGAAGYTIPELAHLARSSHASQRSLAIQTVGRVLHKLVNGQFNKSSELQYALEKLVQSTRIEETLLEAASDKTRSVTVRTHATEALWLYHNKTTSS